MIFVTFSTVQRGIPVDPFFKVPKTFRARKAVPKTPTHSCCKAGLFTFCKGRKIEITARIRALRRLRFEDTKRTMSPKMRPKSFEFGTFEKRTTGLKITRLFKARALIP